MAMMIGLLLQLLPSHIPPLLVLLYFSVLIMQDGTVFLQQTALDVSNDGMRRCQDGTMSMGDNNIIWQVFMLQFYICCDGRSTDLVSAISRSSFVSISLLLLF